MAKNKKNSDCKKSCNKKCGSKKDKTNCKLQTQSVESKDSLFQSGQNVLNSVIEFCKNLVNKSNK